MIVSRFLAHHLYDRPFISLFLFLADSKSLLRLSSVHRKQTKDNLSQSHHAMIKIREECSASQVKARDLMVRTLGESRVGRPRIGEM